jgi:glycosyltransferase involved in cell wall biosynthesis
VTVAAASGAHPGPARSAPAALRVLYVEANEDGTVGGSHQALFDLATRLDGSGYAPVVVFYQDNPFAPRLRDRGIEVHVFEGLRVRERARLRQGPTRSRLAAWLESVRFRIRWLRAQQIALVHLNNSPAVGFDDWLPAARWLGLPCVANSMLTGPLAAEALRAQNAWRRAVKRRLVRGFHRVLAVSDYMVEETARLGVPRDRIVEVPHGVDLERLRSRVRRSRERVRRELGVEDGTVLCAMVANVRPWKGHHVVVEALRRLDPETRACLRVLFVGATAPEHRAYEDALRRTVREAGLADTVTFLGYREDVPDLLHASDIALHASVAPEPGGVAVLEAMALGTPVVAANRGGHVAYLAGGAGLTFDPEEPAQLAACLRRLAASPDERARLAEAARTRVAEYSLDRAVRATLRVYDALLGTQGRGAHLLRRLHTLAPGRGAASP